MSKKTSALMWNFLLSAGLAAAIFFNLKWLGYLVIAFIWHMLIIYLYVLLRHARDPEVQRLKPQLPVYLGWALDILNVGLMLYGGWYITLTVYIASCLCAAQIYFKTRASNTSIG
jgi:hypothetical protein